MVWSKQCYLCEKWSCTLAELSIVQLQSVVWGRFCPTSSVGHSGKLMHQGVLQLTPKSDGDRSWCSDPTSSQGMLWIWSPEPVQYWSPKISSPVLHTQYSTVRKTRSDAWVSSPLPPQLKLSASTPLLPEKEIQTGLLFLSFIQDSIYLFSPLLAISPDKQSDKLVDIFICTVIKYVHVREKQWRKTSSTD